MDYKKLVKKAQEDYRAITGLRSYSVYENTMIQSASERNYFCKCLKLSSKALSKCDECTKETYENAREIDEECIYSCHAGLIKWAVPVNWDDFHCVLVSEGVLAEKQMEEADSWVQYLSKEYSLDKEMLLHNYKIIQKMDEDQMNASITLLKHLLEYHYVMEKEALAHA